MKFFDVVKDSVQQVQSVDDLCDVIRDVSRAYLKQPKHKRNATNNAVALKFSTIDDPDFEDGLEVLNVDAFINELVHSGAKGELFRCYETARKQFIKENRVYNNAHNDALCPPKTSKIKRPPISIEPPSMMTDSDLFERISTISREYIDSHQDLSSHQQLASTSNFQVASDLNKVCCSTEDNQVTIETSVLLEKLRESGAKGHLQDLYTEAVSQFETYHAAAHPLYC